MAEHPQPGPVGEDVTTAQDPLVRAYLSRTRWYRGRQLVLAAVVVAAVLGFVVDRSAPTDEPAESLAPSPSALDQPPPDRQWRTVTMRMSFQWTRYLEPAIENLGDGTWVAHDHMREDQIELRMNDDPAAAELALREWATRNCEWNPRPLYLLRFDDEETVDRLSRLLVDACPGFEIKRTRLRCDCGLIDPGAHPHY